MIGVLKRVTLRALQPVYLEVFREQCALNLRLLDALHQLPAGPEEGSHWLREQLEHCHRVSTRLRHAYLRANLAKQRAWNAAAVELIEQLAGARSGESQPTSALLQSLIENTDPIEDEGWQPFRPLQRELHRRQTDYNRAVLTLLAQHTGVRLPSSASLPEDYPRWRNRRARRALAQVRNGVRGLRSKPLISVIVAVPEGSQELLSGTVCSLLGQLYPAWELVIAPAGGTGKAVNASAEWRDPRVHWLTPMDGADSAILKNAAADRASGGWLVFISCGDRLPPTSLGELAIRVTENTAVEWSYGDEDQLSAMGEPERPWFKPEFSLDLLRSVDHVSGFLAVRADVFRSVGAFRPDTAPMEGYDLALRLARHPVAHLPSVVVHRRARKDDAVEAGAAGRRALEAHLSKTGEDADVTERSPGEFEVRYRAAARPLVSIIVPFRDRPDLLEKLYESLIGLTRYERFEFLLVSNQSTDPATHRLLARLSDRRVRQLSWDHPFNYPAINNFAVGLARGELLLFLNNDIQVADGGWLDELVAQALRPGVGAVGPKLLFPDGRIQHAGVVIGLGGLAGHPFWGLRDGEEAGPFGRASWTRECLAVTSACLITRREVFAQVGGYDETFRLCGSDMDLCLKLRGAGLRVIYTANTYLYHHESVSRGSSAIPEPDLWRSFLAYRTWLERGDPFYNPNLTLADTSCRVRRDEPSAIELSARVLAGRLCAGDLGHSTA
jgi:O-antigen biosynthesis protein